MKQTIDWIRNIPIFREIPQEALASIENISEYIPYQEEEVVFKTNEQADSLYIIANGSVRIEQVYRDGRKKTLAVLLQGQFFGEMAIITESKRCASATSAEDSTLIRISKKPFLDCLKTHGEICFGVLQVICQRLQVADKEISNLTFQNLAGRIARKIIDLSEQFGHYDKDGLTIQLSLTHYDLADMVGTNRESVSKFLTKFKREGSILTRRKRITVLDKSRLLSWT